MGFGWELRKSMQGTWAQEFIVHESGHFSVPNGGALLPVICFGRIIEYSGT